jgi:predicted transcriptional regulator of viral defense system
MKNSDFAEEAFKNLPYFNKLTLEEIIGRKKESLNYWVKKLLREGEIISLKKGLYVSKLYLLGLEKNPGLKEAYLEYLANILRYPSYLSLEYALAKYGLIPEAVYSLTSVTIKSSRIYKNALGNFIYRKISPRLFFGFINGEFEDKRVKIASPAKAIFDFFYFKPFPLTGESQEKFLKDLRINWEILTKKDWREFGEIVRQANSRKMKAFFAFLKKKGVVADDN